MEPDTSKELTTADHVRSMLASQGWKYAYEKFSSRLLDLQNINNLDMSQPDTLSTQLAGRKMAVDEMWAWVKNDLIGFVEQQESNSQALTDKGEEFIGRDL